MSALAELLCDADLDVLGRKDFWDINRLLLAETQHYRHVTITEADWLEGQAHFLEEHHFFTAAAHRLRDEGKAHNLARMRHSLARLNGVEH